MDVKTPAMMKVLDLEFDRKNPRLVELDISDKTSDDRIIEILWNAMDVREVMLSIAASGFFRHEPVIVACEDGQQVVIEGNRRLAAVRILRGEIGAKLMSDLQAQTPTLAQTDKQALAEIPVIRSTRAEVWRYLGFKHVNGPAKWSSYAKACFIARVHQDYGTSLDAIAYQIGDTHRTVQRLFRGLMVMKQAEKLKVFQRKNRYKKHLSFSHLYTGLDYEGISGFLHLSSADEDTSEPVPANRKRELGELMRWLYGDKRSDIPPVVQSPNPHLRQLDTVVAHPEALEVLRLRGHLEDALETSQEPYDVFRASLVKAKQELQRARGMLTTGYDGSKDLLQIANQVAELADDLYMEMERKQLVRRQRRREGR